jgi:hypothetical protein
VVQEGKLADSFEVTTGVRHGCVVPQILLRSALDKVVRGRKRGMQWRMTESLEDFYVAAYISLLAQRWSNTKAKLEKLEEEAVKVRLKIMNLRLRK